MKKVGKEKQARLEELQAEIAALGRTAEEAQAEYLKVIEEKFQPYADAILALNAMVEEYNDTVDEVVSEIEDFISEKSERWQESEAGEKYAGWRDLWQTVRLEPTEVPDRPDAGDGPDVPIFDEGLPYTPDDF